MIQKPEQPTFQERFDLAGQTAIVTGDALYLGSAMATALTETGAKLVVTTRDEKNAVEAASQLPDRNGTGHLDLPLGHLGSESIEEFFDRAVTAAGRIDTLVNSAHQPPPGGTPVDSPLSVA